MSCIGVKKLSDNLILSSLPHTVRHYSQNILKELQMKTFGVFKVQVQEELKGFQEESFWRIWPFRKSPGCMCKLSPNCKQTSTCNFLTDA